MKDLGDIAHPAVLTDGVVRLRELRAADKAAVVKACNDGLVERFCYRVPYPYHENDFVEFLAYNEHFWATDLMANWTVVDPQSDELLRPPPPRSPRRWWPCSRARRRASWRPQRSPPASPRPGAGAA